MGRIHWVNIMQDSAVGSAGCRAAHLKLIESDSANKDNNEQDEEGESEQELFHGRINPCKWQVNLGPLLDAISFGRMAQQRYSINEISTKRMQNQFANITDLESECPGIHADKASLI
jgi:hypothetical protein